MRRGLLAGGRKRGKIYIVTLPVWNSTLRWREGSIPDYPYMKVFLADGNRTPPQGLKKVGACRSMQKAGYRPGTSVASEESAGGEA